MEIECVTGRPYLSLPFLIFLVQFHYYFISLKKSWTKNIFRNVMGKMTVHQISLCYTGQIKTKEIRDTVGQCYNTKKLNGPVTLFTFH